MWTAIAGAWSSATGWTASGAIIASRGLKDLQGLIVNRMNIKRSKSKKVQDILQFFKNEDSAQSHPVYRSCCFADGSNRLREIHPDGSDSGFWEGLRAVALAEVKWCSEMPGAMALP